MILELENVVCTNVWEDSFVDKETNEVVRYWRVLLTKAGEPPCQLKVQEQDFEEFKKNIGKVGTALIELDAQPNRRMRVVFAGMA